MKKNNFTSTILLFTACFLNITLQAQTFHTIPNPTSTGSFRILGAGGALSGYAGTPIVLNNSLVLEYNASNFNQNYFAGTQTTLQLAVYKGGDSLSLIPNPDGGLGIYFQEPGQTVYHNKLYLGYINASKINQLASFDGDSLKLFPNPDASTGGEAGSFRIFRDTLYGLYINASNVYQFAKVTSNGFVLIPNPDNSPYGFNFDYAFIFNDRICARYVNAAGVAVLATFDGNAWTMWPNPDNTTYGYQPLFPIVYHNKLYIQYYTNHQFQLMEWDGTNNPVLIPNPENSSVNNGGYAGYPIVYNDTLFFKYYSADYTNHLAKFDGTTVSLVPSPQAYNYYNGFINSPVIYNNKLYLNYVALDGKSHLALYNNTSGTLSYYPNPDGGAGYQGQAFVYNNLLFFQYTNLLKKWQLGYYNGTDSLNLLTSPPGAYNSIGSDGYTGYPLIWNNLLYLQYAGIPYGNAGNLVTFNSGNLPVTFLNFNGRLSGNDALLSWSTASEINNKGFEVQKSLDGINFKDIGFVTGLGNASLVNNYSYTDAKLLSGSNYYRLKQIDRDGRVSYSAVIRISYSHFSYGILGNPSNNPWLQLQLDKQDPVSIQIYSVNGTLIQKMDKGTLTAGTYDIPLNLTSCNPGVYVMRLLVGSQSYSTKIVK